jgi:hypothetical protein
VWNILVPIAGHMLAPAARLSGYTQDKVALAIANFLLISCHGAGIAGRSGLTECM